MLNYSLGQAVVHLQTISDFQIFRKSLQGKIGFVPTMGALHEGHLSLIRESKKENNFTIASIFVNPIQFNNADDFAKYPNVLDRDLNLLEREGCDAVFAPSASEMYPTPPHTKFNFGSLETVLEGAFRPGHFNGVAIVVAKLFHIVNPDVAYFGQKDLQQTLVVKQLVRDLQFPLVLRVCDTVREEDGLAMSSRNVRLTQEFRKEAPILFASMTKLRDTILSGGSVLPYVRYITGEIKRIKGVRVEYLEAVDTQSLLAIGDDYIGEVALCVAAYFGEVRLIDNIVFYKAS